MEHAGQLQVIREASLAREEGQILPPFDTDAEDRPAHGARSWRSWATTSRTAATIPLYPVQRQRLPASASRISCSSRISGRVFSRSTIDIRSPGVQNPHWSA